MAKRKFVVLKAHDLEGLKFADYSTAEEQAQHKCYSEGGQHYVAEILSAFEVESSVKERKVE